MALASYSIRIAPISSLHGQKEEAQDPPRTDCHGAGRALADLPAVTAPGDLAKLTRFLPDPGTPTQTKSPSLVSQAAALQGVIDREAAALEDLGNPDGLSRLPAGFTPTVPFSKLKAHCEALKKLPPKTWIEIDESGQVLSPAIALGNCHFEPYQGPNGRPLAVRALYTVAK